MPSVNRTLLGECFRLAIRTTWHTDPAEIQRDLDRVIEYEGMRGSHRSRRLSGRMSALALREALGLDELPPPPGPEAIAEGAAVSRAT